MVSPTRLCTEEEKRFVCESVILRGRVRASGFEPGCFELLGIPIQETR